MPRKPLAAMTDDEVEDTLSPAERAMEDAFLQGLEDGTVVSLLTPAPSQETRTAPASGKTTAISLRLPTADLTALQDEAALLGMKYQSLLKSILHQYLTGQLFPRKP